MAVDTHCISQSHTSPFHGPAPVCGEEVSPEFAEAFRRRLLNCWRTCSRVFAVAVSSSQTDELTFADFQRAAIVALKGTNVDSNSNLYHAMWEYLLGGSDGSVLAEHCTLSLPQLVDAFEEVPFSLPEASKMASMRLLLQLDGFGCVRAHFRPTVGVAVTRREFIMGLARVDVGESVASAWFSRLQAEGAEGGAGGSGSQSLPLGVLQAALLRAVLPAEDDKAADLVSGNSGTLFEALALCFIHEWGDLSLAFGCSLDIPSSCVPSSHHRVNPPPNWYSMSITTDGKLGMQTSAATKPPVTASHVEQSVLGKSQWLRALRGQGLTAVGGNNRSSVGRFFSEAEAQKYAARAMATLKADGEESLDMCSFRHLYLPTVGDILCCAKGVYQPGELAMVKYTLAGPGFWGDLSIATTKHDALFLDFPLSPENLGQRPFIAIMKAGDTVPNVDLPQCRAVLDPNVTRGVVVLRIPDVREMLPSESCAFRVFASMDGVTPICQVGQALRFTVQVSAPPAPGPVHVTEVNSTSVCGEWARVSDAPLRRISHYDLGVWNATAAFGSPPLHIVPCAACDMPTNRGIVHSLEPGTAYYLRVRAVSECGTGSWGPLLPCMPHFTTTNLVPDAPLRSPTVVAIDAHRVKLYWIMEHHNFHITHFLIEACRTTSPSTSRSLLLAVSEADVQGKEVIATVGPLEHNTEYAFTIRYMNESGTSSASPASDPIRTDPGPPGPPSEPELVRADMGTLSLRWTAPLDTGGALVSHYFVTAYMPDGGNGKAEPYIVRTIDALHCSAVFNGLENNKVYTFDVRAANRVGTGPASNRSAGFSCDSRVPSPPKYLQCLGWAGDTVTVKWDPPLDSAIAGVSAYTMMTIDTCAEDDNMSTMRTSADSRKLMLRGLQRNRVYAVFVFAENSSGISPPSERLDLYNPGLTGSPSMSKLGENRPARASFPQHRPFARPRQNTEHLVSIAERWRNTENDNRASSFAQDNETGYSTNLPQFFPHATTLLRVNSNDLASSIVSFVEPRVSLGENNILGTPKASPRASPQSSPQAESRSMRAGHSFAGGKDSPRRSPSPPLSPRALTRSPPFQALPTLCVPAAPPSVSSRSSFPLPRNHRLNRSPSGALRAALAAGTSSRKSVGSTQPSPRQRTRNSRVEAC